MKRNYCVTVHRGQRLIVASEHVDYLNRAVARDVIRSLRKRTCGKNVCKIGSEFARESGPIESRNGSIVFCV